MSLLFVSVDLYNQSFHELFWFSLCEVFITEPDDATWAIGSVKANKYNV